jgi:hypothetical protein
VEESPCPSCDGDLRTYNGVRYISFLNERLEIVYDFKRCGRKACPPVMPPFLRSPALPGYEYQVLPVFRASGYLRLPTGAT